MPVHHFVRAIGNYHSLLHYISLSQGTSKRTLLLLSPALLHAAMLWHRRPEIAVVSHCSLGHCVRQDFAQGWGWMTTYFNARIDAYHDNALRRLQEDSLPPANGPRGSDPPQQPGSSQATSQVPSPLQEMDRGEQGHWSSCPSPLSHFLLIYMQLRGSICMVWLLCGSYMNNLHPATGTEPVATQQLLQACLSALQEPVLLLTCFLLV